MFGIDRQAARWTWTAAVVVVALVLLYQIRATLFLFILAVLFAYLLSPAVNLLDRALPGRARTLALAVVYAIFVGLVVLVVTQIGSRVVEEAHSLAGKFPDMLGSWFQQTGKAPASLQEQILFNVRSGLTEKINEIIGAIPNAGLKFLSVASNIIYIVVVPILAFFFLKDGAIIRTHILEAVSSTKFTRALADNLMEDVHDLLAKYMRALVILSMNTFVCYATFFSILGVPYGVLLAVLAMMLEFIPMIGPLVAAASILLVAAVAGAHVVGGHVVAGEHLLAILIFLIIFRMFQDYVISPQIMGQGVELHPLLILFGVFAGGELAGIAGSFLSVPMLALIRIFYLRMRRQRVAQ
jgi:predicted PurR-regulated permease PerM